MIYTLYSKRPIIVRCCEWFRRQQETYYEVRYYSGLREHVLSWRNRPIKWCRTSRIHRKHLYYILWTQQFGGEESSLDRKAESWGRGSYSQGNKNANDQF